MAAPAAGLGAPAAAPSGDAAANGQQAEGQQGQEAQAPNGADQVQAQLEQMAQAMEAQRQFLETAPWAQQDESQQEEAPVEQPPDLSFLDGTMPPEQAAQQLAALIESAAESKATAAVGPVQEQLQTMQRQQAADQLLGEFPQLGDDAVAKQTLDTAAQLAAQFGHPELADEPGFWRTVYLAGRAGEQAKAEAAAGGGSEATLEGAGGASPGGAGQGAQPTAASILGGTNGRNSLALFQGRKG